MAAIDPLAWRSKWRIALINDFDSIIITLLIPISSAKHQQRMNVADVSKAAKTDAGKAANMDAAKAEMALSGKRRRPHTQL